VQQAQAPRRGLDSLLAILASLGFAFTVYLTALELFIIHAICRWCVGSAAIITAIAVLSLGQLRAGRDAQVR
jgi:uncharacterized membrane protein